MKTLIPVVLYLRMSSDKQECSIDDQRKALVEYCRKHGYRIVGEYIDEGISGWKSKQRLGFQQLIADAPKREFQAVICWDQSRFSRFDPMEANYFWHILRREEVRIETIKEGKLDLDTLGGWLTASISQHGKAEYVRSLAHDCARGQRRQRALGYWLCRAPVGYRKPPGKNVFLVLGPPEEIELVRRVFNLRKQGHGYRGIAAKLNAEGVKAMYGRGWGARQIHAMCRREVYIGNSVTGYKSRPKFADKATVKTITGTHPAIIDRETWDAVQAMNGKMRKRHAGNTSGTSGEGAPLAGLLHCANCGHTMYTVNFRDKYVCGSYHRKGECSHNMVHRRDMLEVVAAKIREFVLMGSLDKLTEAIESGLAKERAEAPRLNLGDVRRQIAAIDAKLATAAERMMTIVPSLVPTMEAKMLDLQRQRAELEASLKAPAAEPKKQRTAKEMAADLWRLDEVLRSGSPAVVRTILSKLIERINVQFVEVPSGRKQPFHVPVGGEIQLSKCAHPFHSL